MFLKWYPLDNSALFYPFRELVTKTIHEYFQKEFGSQINHNSIQIFIHVYQFLYFAYGDKNLAKNYYEQNYEKKFHWIPRDVLEFYPDSNLKEFLDTLPWSNTGDTVMTSEPEVFNLINTFGLKAMADYLQNLRNIYGEVLSMALNHPEPIERKIMLSFVSNLDHFFTISRFMLSSTFYYNVHDVISSIFPPVKQQSYSFYNYIVAQFPGSNSNNTF